MTARELIKALLKIDNLDAPVYITEHPDNRYARPTSIAGLDEDTRYDLPDPVMVLVTNYVDPPVGDEELEEDDES